MYILYVKVTVFSADEQNKRYKQAIVFYVNRNMERQHEAR